MNRFLMTCTAVAALAAFAAGCDESKSAAKCGATCATTPKCCKTEEKAAVQMPKNEDFYQDGKFQAAKAAEAYYAMMKRFGVPVYKRLQTEEFWAIDFGLNEFAKVGMAGIFWVNEKEDGYFGHEIYLLPGQMIVEHSHVDVAENNVKPKIESWQVRHGSVYGFSEGTPNLDTMPEAKIPESQKKFSKVNHVELWTADGYAHKLPAAKSWHFMMAGPEGAIVTEYATFHDNKGLRFANPNVKF